MSADLIHALEQLEKDKGIDKDVIIEAIEAALISAYKRSFGLSQNVKVFADRQTVILRCLHGKGYRNPQNDLLKYRWKTRKINPSLKRKMWLK